MLLIFGITLIVSMGYLLSLILVKKLFLLERVGLSVLLGFGLLTLIMLCYSTLGVKITLNSTLLSIIIFLTLELFTLKLMRVNIFAELSNTTFSLTKLSFLEKILVFSLASILFGSFLLATYFPVYIWDALAIYDFRGKVIADLGFYTQIAKNYYWFDGYPLFTSLSHTLIYFFGGKNPQFIYSLFYISFIFIFYGTMRKYTTRLTALFFSMLLAATPLVFQHSTFAYTNLPYTIFLSLGSIYLYIWLSDKRGLGYLILAAILTGLSTWTRSTEPFWMVHLVLLVVLVLYRFRSFTVPFLLYTIVFFAIREPWNIVNRYVSSGEGDLNGGIQIVQEISSYGSSALKIPLKIDRIFEVTDYIYKNVVVSWYPTIFLFILCLALNIKGIFKQKSSTFLLIIMLYFGLLLYGTYAYTFGPTSWREIPDSARRMAMFFIPLMIYYSGLTIDRFLANAKRK